MMKKNHFKMTYDRDSESWVVVKSTDELTKNHRDIGEQISGIMPEKKGDPLSCTLLLHLHQPLESRKRVPVAISIEEC